MVASDCAPLLVVSQPDRPAGRGRRLVAPPVAVAARRNGLALIQPETVRDSAFLATLEELAPEVAVVVAFGQIFRPELLALPPRGCVNLHASLLPRWRGAAPIQAAIAHGDSRTGVSTMHMTAGLDSGPVLLKAALAIGPDETAPELADRLAALGAGLMVRTLEALARGDWVAREQDVAGVTLAPRLTRADGEVDWSQPAPVLYRAWRAYQPWPGLTTSQDGRRLKLLAVVPHTPRDTPRAARRPAPPGTILGLDGEAVTVACGSGSALGLLRVQRPGRAATSAAAWAHGERRNPGDRFDRIHPRGEG